MRKNERKGKTSLSFRSCLNSRIYYDNFIGGVNLKILEMFKNRTILGITCIVLALVICFVISPLISKTGNKTVNIVRATAEIKSGDEITKDMVTEVRMSISNQPENIIESTKSVIGKYATMDMTKGDYVLSDKIADTPYVENTYLAGLDGSNRAISVTIKAFANGLSGKLKSGDIVSVIAPDYKKTGITQIPLELQYVEVIAATTKSGSDVADEFNDESELPSTVTLLVSEEQSKMLADLEKTGTIHMSLVYRGDRKTAEEFLKKQNELNDSLKADTTQAEESEAEGDATQ